MITVSPARILQIHDLGYQNNPFVAWSNLGAAATLGGTAVLTGGERANAVTGSTYDKWRPDVTTSEAVLSFDFGSTTALKFAAIASHNAHKHGASVAVQTSSDGTTWADAGTGAVVAVAGVMAFRFSASARYWRFRFTGLTSGDDLSVGIAFLGNETIFPRRFYQGFTPVLTPTEVELQSNVSVGAHLMGSYVIERGSTISVSVQNIPAAFIRSDEWNAFQTAFGEGKGFFFAWRPAKYPEDIHYCWRDGGVIRPSNTGPRDLMNIEFSARAFNG